MESNGLSYAPTGLFVIVVGSPKAFREKAVETASRRTMRPLKPALQGPAYLHPKPGEPG